MAIKLFGKTIQIPSAREVLVMDREESGEEAVKAASNIEDDHDRNYQNEEAPNSFEEESDEQTYSTTNQEKANTDILSSKSDEHQNKESRSSMDNTPKKPDKVLPCPRCNSMDTKFCYYNNYNVNQPRYFCKNCQRYWTAGGSMRNVPVGAGRRKSKSYAVNHRRRIYGVHDGAGDSPCESIHHSSPLKHSGTLLSFGPDAHLNQSKAPVVDLMKKKINDEAWSKPSFTTALNSNSDDINKAANSNLLGFPPNLNCNHWPNPLSHTPTNMHIPFYTLNTCWGIPWLTPQPLISPIKGSFCSPLHSTNLGKHTREGNMLNHSNSDKVDSAKSDKPFWIPKTLRINDTEDAAKCSIMAALGLKKGKVDSFSGGKGFFKAFQPYAELENKLTEETSRVLCANPAALSRSVGFRERS